MKTPSSLLLAWTLCALATVETSAWISPKPTTRTLQRLHIASSKESTAENSKQQEEVPIFLHGAFNTECDNINRPPSLNIIVRSIEQMTAPGKTDIRGQFVDHARLGPISQAAHAIGQSSCTGSAVPALTPLAAYCIGAALADQLLEARVSGNNSNSNTSPLTIAVGQDPRLHGRRLIDALVRGAESRDNVVQVACKYTGIATTPACAAFCRQLAKADAAVMVTASHLPGDRNGFKFYAADSEVDIQQLGQRAVQHACDLYSQGGALPASSGHDSVMCSEWVNWMPDYAAALTKAVVTQVDNNNNKPLEGLTIVLNSGNGAGGFFNDVLKGLGANVDGSMHVEPDGHFPAGVPNPEDANMVQATVAQCAKVQADLGILLDTDADRCGFVVPRGNSAAAAGDKLTEADYEPLNRNRLIALLGVVFSRTKPGCAIVTDSVTSEGLATFLGELGLQHVRYLKGYANVINKAKELTDSGSMNAEVAIETSGHCAMRENDYLDDGTYTAVKIVSLLAMERAAAVAKDSQAKVPSLLCLISELQELDEIAELRMTVTDGSLDTMQAIFDYLALKIETLSASTTNAAVEAWQVDNENLEGIRVRTGNDGFFMLRKSLHDPILSVQIEGRSKDEVRRTVIGPLLELLESDEPLLAKLDASILQEYCQ